MGFLTVLRIILAIINIIANLIGFLFSIIIIVIGIVGLVAINFFFSGMNEDLLFYNVGFSLYLAIGVIASLFTIAAIVGSYMACCPSSKLVKIIAVTILSVHLIAFVIVFILALAAVIVAFVFRDQVATSFVGVLNRAINESYSLDFNTTQVAIALIQSTIGCCGVNGPSDFLAYPGYTNVTTYLPPGCCDNDTITCMLSGATEAVGCGPIIQGLLVNYYNAIGGVGIFELIVIFLLIVVEILLIVLVIKGDDENGSMKIV